MLTNKLFVTLTIFSLLLIFADRTFHFQAPRNLTQAALQPVFLGLHGVGLNIFETIDFLKSLPTIYRENKELHRQINEQTFLEIANEQLKEENQALRNQLTLQTTSSEKLLPAQVLGKVNLGSEVFLVIDKGKKDGLGNQGAVVIEKNLIGKIDKVQEHVAFAQPLFSSKSQVAVKVGKKQVRGVVVGELNSRVKLTEVLQEDKIENGDLIVSSGAEGVFPPNLLVGQIKKVIKKDWEVYQGGEVEMFWDPKELKAVFVVL